MHCHKATYYSTPNLSLSGLCKVSVISYLFGFTETFHSLLVGEALEANPVYLQQSVACGGHQKHRKMPIQVSSL